MAARSEPAAVETPAVFSRRRRPRLQDLAREAGVGTATVERVLNARGGVSDATARRVIVAARKLGYDRPLPDLYHALVQIEVVLVRPDTAFFSRLSAEFQKLAGSLDRLIVLHRSFTREDAPETTAQRIREVADRRAGLIVVAQDHPAIVVALREADARGVATVLLVSDLQYGGNAVYVGIDNESAGRTAGFFMRHLLRGRSGRVIALCHSGLYVTHRQRIAGFGRHFPRPDAQLRFTHCLAGRDSDELSYRLLSGVLRECDDVIGIYNAGGGHRAVDRALREQRRSAGIVYIGHELSPESRELLGSGVMMLAIDQMPELQVRRAIEVLERLIGLREGPVDRSPIAFRIITPENLDS